MGEYVLVNMIYWFRFWVQKVKVKANAQVETVRPRVYVTDIASLHFIDIRQMVPMYAAKHANFIVVECR